MITQNVVARKAGPGWEPSEVTALEGLEISSGPTIPTVQPRPVTQSLRPLTCAAADRR